MAARLVERVNVVWEMVLDSTVSLEYYGKEEGIWRYFGPCLSVKEGV